MINHKAIQPYNRINMFKKVDPKVSFPQLEEETLKYWEENKIFEQSVANREGKPKYSFNDGPPFATGLTPTGMRSSDGPMRRPRSRLRLRCRLRRQPRAGNGGTNTTTWPHLMAVAPERFWPCAR